MSQMLDNSSSTDHQLQEVMKTLEELKDVSLSPVKSSMFKSSSIHVPGEGCNGLDYTYNVKKEDKRKKTEGGGKPKKRKDVLQKDVLHNTQIRLKELATLSAVDIMNEVSNAQLWSDGVINEFWVNYEANQEEEEDVQEDYGEEEIETVQSNVNVITKAIIKRGIKEQVEVQLADGTGKFDYASLLGGASVVRDGVRRTSLSLVDDLPVLNKILSAGRMRFYGHSAEVALVPTYPKDSLGQCWSFESEDVSKLRKGKYRVAKDDGELGSAEAERADDVGVYATLMVRLSGPVYVSSVVLEHPPKEISTDMETAVRDVRVLGFEDGDGVGDAWELGRFRYEIDSEDWAQEFYVATEVDGERVPPLHSIMLAIDSNWGSDYSCLYRFRVHGRLP
uniref:SUN domain-containing protein n=1 Tax=Ditylum brightwellii TaxID=49249 RepID=A0A7S1ZQF2_9STRA